MLSKPFKIGWITSKPGRACNVNGYSSSSAKMGNFYPLPNLQFLTDRLQIGFEWLRHGELQPCQRGFGSVQRFGLPVVVKYTRTVTFFLFFVFNFSESRPGQTRGPICTHDSSKYAAWRKEVPSGWDFVFVFTFWGSFCPKTAKKSFGIGISQPNSKTLSIQRWEISMQLMPGLCAFFIGQRQ